MTKRRSFLARTRTAWALALWVGVLGCGSRLLRMQTVPVSDSERLYLGGGGNSFALLHGREVFLVDAKLGDFARRMRHDVRELPGRRVSRLLLTHSHADHTGGLDLFAQDAVVLAHPRTRARLERDAPLPEVRWIDVDQEIRLQLGRDEVWVLSPGRAHTDGDLVAYLPGRKLLIAGDLLVAGRTPVADLSAGGSLLAYGPTLDRVLALDFEAVLPGHGPLGTRAEVVRLREYLRALEKEVRGAVAQGKTEEQTAQAVRLEAFEDLKDFAPVTSREGNVRQLYRELSVESRPWPDDR